MIAAENVQMHEPWLVPHLPDADGRAALDVGAHIGMFAMDLLPRFDVVHCFEPSPRVLDVLRYNLRVAEMEGRAAIHPVAIGATDGQIELNLFEGSMQASMYTDADLETMPRGPVWQKVPVQLRSLDSMGFDDVPVDYIKVDVEGAELDVIVGARDTIAANRPQLLIECHTLHNRDELVRILSDMYDLTLIKHPHSGVPEGHSWIAARFRVLP